MRDKRGQWVDAVTKRQDENGKKKKKRRQMASGRKGDDFRK